MAEQRRDEWNALVAGEPCFALPQAWEWGEFKQQMGWQAYRVALDDGGRLVAGAQLLMKPLPGRCSLAYVPRGPVGRWTADGDFAPLLAGLHRSARARRAAVLRIEPGRLHSAAGAGLFQRHGFRPAAQTNQPRASIVLDLTAGSDALLRRMHHKTRYNIRRAMRKGVQVRTGGFDDLEVFHRLLRMTARRTGMVCRSEGYYRREWATLARRGLARLLLAYHGGKPLAANLSAAFGGRAAYLHGASSGEHRDLMPNHLLMWEAIRWAEGNGCRSFDLWGVPEEVGVAVTAGAPLPATDRTDGLWGVYRFKRGFGTAVSLHLQGQDYGYSMKGRVLLAAGAFGEATLDRAASLADSLRRTGPPRARSARSRVFAERR